MVLGNMVPGKAPSQFLCTVDHLIPKASGGTNRRDNLVAACFHCNGSRGTIDHKAYKWFVEEYGRKQKPYLVFRHLDKKSPEYTDNRDKWVSLSVRQHVKPVMQEQLEIIDIPAWEPEWKERRRSITLARREASSVVNSIPFSKKNELWGKYLKEEKNVGSSKD